MRAYLPTQRLGTSTVQHHHVQRRTTLSLPQQSSEVLSVQLLNEAITLGQAQNTRRPACIGTGPLGAHEDDVLVATLVELQFQRFYTALTEQIAWRPTLASPRKGLFAGSGSGPLQYRLLRVIAETRLVVRRNVPQSFTGCRRNHHQRGRRAWDEAARSLACTCDTVYNRMRACYGMINSKQRRTSR